MEVPIITPVDEEWDRDNVPVCGGENACEIMNDFLEQDTLPLLKADIQKKIDEHTIASTGLQKKLIDHLTNIARLQNKLDELKKFKSIDDLSSSLIKNFIE